MVKKYCGVGAIITLPWQPLSDVPVLEQRTARYKDYMYIVSTAAPAYSGLCIHALHASVLLSVLLT